MTSQIMENYTLIKQLVEARLAQENQNYSLSRTLFTDAFEAHPQMWWLAMEALRAKKLQLHNIMQENYYQKHLYFSPNYTEGNPYQSNLYSSSESFGFLVEPIDKINLKEPNVHHRSLSHTIFHQHWIKNFYWNSSSYIEGIQEIDKCIGTLKAYKIFGAKVAWTLHNLIDHDATPLQAELCLYTHRKMADISDVIFVHSLECINKLNEQCGCDLSTKCYLLEHHLYDNYLAIKDIHPPEELEQEKLTGKIPILCLGLLRPYKGVPNILLAFEKITNINPHHQLFLIIAGKVCDVSIGETRYQLNERTQKRILLIDRRLMEQEMIWLIKSSVALVTAYQNILISGSFYLATTFRRLFSRP